MNEIVEALVAALKEEEVYQNYLVCLKDLKKEEALLLKYRQAKQEYLDMRPYFQYQDFSELKETVQSLSKQVENLLCYQKYMLASSALEKRLNELGNIVFEGIFLEMEETGCESSPENTSVEI